MTLAEKIRKRNFWGNDQNIQQELGPPSRYHKCFQLIFLARQPRHDKPKHNYVLVPLTSCASYMVMKELSNLCLLDTSTQSL